MSIFKKGNIIIRKGDDAEKLNNMRPLDYVMQFFEKRIPKSIGAQVLVKPKTVEDRILVLRAETGSGKSTILIAELYHRFFAGVQKNIVVTQPRVLTAKEIPESMLFYNTKEYYIKAKTPGREVLKLGKNIGYQTGQMSKRIIRGILYVTPQLLLNHLKVMTDEQFMKKYFMIVIDEVHERYVASDLLMYMLKNFIQRNAKNSKCPFLILTSATFDTKRFANYFGVPKNIIEIKGLSYPITDIFLKYDADNFITAAVEKARDIHKTNPKDFEGDMRDIIIFVPGMSHIRKILKGLDTLNKTDDFFKKHPSLNIALNSDIFIRQTPEYKSIFHPYEKLRLPGSKLKPVRRIIVSTNIAETGVTIETLRYVIDTGYQNSNEFIAAFGVSALVQKPVFQSGAMQRRGRGGRKAPGVWYPLYTKEIFDQMQKNQYPQIITDDVTSFMLDMFIAGAGIPSTNELKDYFEKNEWKAEVDITKFDLLDYPLADSMHYSVDKLYRLGAIDSECNPTKLGVIMQKFMKISIESVRMILAGYAWDVCIPDLITIAAMQFIGDRSIYPMMEAGKFARAKKSGKFCFGMGAAGFDVHVADGMLELLAVFQDFSWQLRYYKTGDKKSLHHMRDWCDDNGLSYKGMIDVLEIRDDIIDSMVNIGFNPFHNHEKYIGRFPSHEVISKYKQCIYEGYKCNLIVLQDTYRIWKTGQAVKLPLKTKSRYILFDEARLSIDRMSNMYDYKFDFLSVMDGFVSVCI